MIGSYKPGTGITLGRNPSWSASTDFRPAYADRINMPQGNTDPSVAARRVLEGSKMLSGDWLLSPPILQDSVDPGAQVRAAARYPEGRAGAQAAPGTARRCRRRPRGGAERQVSSV